MKPRNLLIVLLMLGFLLSQATVCAAGDQKIHILYLNSYNKGYPWSDSITSGIENTLADYSDIEIHIEYFDAQSMYNEELFGHIKDLFAYKYAIKQPDIIIVSDDTAFLFILEYGNEIFPDIPIVFTGVNNFNESILAGHTDITGAIEALPIYENIVIALKINPDLDTVYAIVDDSYTGMSIREEMETIVEAMNRDIKVVYPVRNSYLTDIQNNISALPEDSVVMAFRYFIRDKTGNYYDLGDVIGQISSKSDIPIITPIGSYIGEGALGGASISPYDMGTDSAKKALAILQGEDADAIPVGKTQEISYVFDYNQLKRFGIEQKQLPEKAVIVNEPVRSISINIWAAVFLVTLITGLVVGVFMLYYFNRKLSIARNELIKKNEETTSLNIELFDTKEQLQEAVTEQAGMIKELEESKNKIEKSEERFNSFMTYLPAAAFIIDPESRIIFKNTYYDSIFGTDDSIIGKTPHEIYPAKTADAILEKDRMALIEGYYSLEEKITDAAGNTRFLMTHKFSMKGGPDKTLIGGISIDISKQKSTEARLRSSLNEKVMLLSDNHHRVKNNLTIILSIIQMQMQRTEDEEAKTYLFDMASRIHSLAFIHESLYQSKIVSRIDAQDMLSQLLDNIILNYSRKYIIETSVNAYGCTLDLETATPLSLVINELVMNSIKHAFPSKEINRIWLEMTCEDEIVTIKIGDNGKGLPEDFSLDSTKTIGIRLMKNIVQMQLKGDLTFETGPGGTVWSITYRQQF